MVESQELQQNGRFNMDLTTWNVMAPRPDTWNDFAFHALKYLTWDEVFRSWTITEPSIEVYNGANVCDREECNLLNGCVTNLPTVTVYENSDNLNILRLLNRNDIISLDGTTKIDLILPDDTILSSTVYPAEIEWSTGGEPLGLVFLRLGSLTLFDTEYYRVRLFVYSNIATYGIFWGYFRVRAIKGEEG